MSAQQKNWIPKVPEEHIRELADKIKPVVRFAHGAEGPFLSAKGFPYYIEPVDLFRIAYAWDPKPTEEATQFKPICDITTFHTYAYYGFFKPTIAEVLSQIPDEYLDTVIAFEIVGQPETATDLNREREALNAGYHVATTRLYAKE